MKNNRIVWKLSVFGGDIFNIFEKACFRNVSWAYCLVYLVERIKLSGVMLLSKEMRVYVNSNTGQGKDRCDLFSEYGGKQNGTIPKPKTITKTRLYKYIGNFTTKKLKKFFR